MGGDLRAERRLLIFAKLPEPGRTKTRLIPSLGPEGAADLYAAFLDDTVEMTARVSGAERQLWVMDQPDAKRTLARRYPCLPIRRQAEGDLGDRLREAFGASFRDGVDYVTILGSDHPTLPPAYLERGFAALGSAHLVLGPSRDGGYYAIGLRRYAWPRAERLFHAIPWSTAGVLEATRARARELDLCHVELPDWYDVDEPEDLPRLARDVDEASHTSKALDRLLPDRA